ncbi:MAG TPA: rhamnogalacturonan acetylesterase [Prevotellaceae bacterium]|uniref:rhamnogalacturonan acetylesterase n=1 Tax=Xylanibacter rarus TaxID=1676614 RepID=UPI0025811A64|nr:rhamnogalacturonan acetylesterase [Prevotella sp.]MBS5875032.1 rhamnogalacturonan acetylesterase [Prevotella sp.]HJH76227.1 rhamnogalacturonan acetylesterase [Prevotellaceae bacterium]
MNLFKSTLLAAGMLVSTSMMAIKVHTIGDSTMATYSESTTVTRGWGQMFQQFFTDAVTVNNRAKSGASSKSFYEEAAYWESVKKQIQPGDYVLIQFAHNDEKNDGMDGDEVKAYYESIGDQAKADATDYRGTTASGTYKEYLRKYVEETRALGATPVLVGAICRKYFTGSTIRRNGRHDLGDDFSLLTASGIKEGNKVGEDDHTYDYPYQMRLVADEMGVSYIDLTTATKELYESYGDAKANELLFDGDGSTHTSAMGATLIARLCAQLLQKQGILTEYINLTSDLSVNPSKADLGEAYKGQTVVKEFQISGFDLQPAEGNVTITASKGLQVSADGESYSGSISMSYKEGNMIGTFYARCEFAEEGPINEEITVTSGDKTITIPVTGTSIVLEGGVPVQAYWRLEKDDECEVTGPMNTLGQSYSGMTLQKYSAPNTNTTWPEWTGFDASRKTQRNVIEGESWPAGEIDEVSTRYIEFAVQPAKGTTLKVDSMSMFVCGCGGNGMCCKIYYSKEENFANPVNIFEMKSMPANNMQYVCSMPVLSVNEGETLRIRVYPWYNNAATGKTICLSDVTIHGIAVDSTTGISSELTQNAAPVRTVYYGTDGTMRQGMRPGLNIVKKEYADGKVETTKILY